MTQIPILTYSDLRQRERSLELHKTEMPIEHDKSLPMPSLRWGLPLYACFASPALLRPGQPKEVGAPDRWWLVDAQHGRLLLYARWQVLPYAQNVQWKSVILPLEKRTIAELKTLISQIEQLLNTAVPVFFAGSFLDQPTRTALLAALHAYIPVPIWAYYQTLTPDFFAWMQI